MAEKNTIGSDPFTRTMVILAWGSVVNCVFSLCTYTNRLHSTTGMQFFYLGKIVRRAHDCPTIFEVGTARKQNSGVKQNLKEKWGFIDTGFNSASVNMALDEKLLNWHNRGKIPPTLRFYGWSKPSLSVGHFQNAEKAIHFSNIQKHGCEFVRRLTGGSAVLHDDELTYSIVISEDKDYIPTSIQAAYYVLSKGVLAGYKQLGIEADYATPEKQTERTDVCFEKPAFYEMLVDGKKISGNAQTRQQGVLLQHGSIPMSINKDMLFDLFKFPTESIRETKRNAFPKKATTINEITKKQHTYDDLKEAFQKGFQTELDIEVTPLKLSDSQWSEVLELAKSKYSQEEWNLYHQRSV